LEVGQTSYLAMPTLPSLTISTNTAPTLGGLCGSVLPSKRSPLDIAYALTRPAFRCEDVVSGIGATDLVAMMDTSFSVGRPSLLPHRRALCFLRAGKPPRLLSIRPIGALSVMVCIVMLTPGLAKTLILDIST